MLYPNSKMLNKLVTSQIRHCNIYVPTKRCRELRNECFRSWELHKSYTVFLLWKYYSTKTFEYSSTSGDIRTIIKRVMPSGCSSSDIISNVKFLLFLKSQVNITWPIHWMRLKFSLITFWVLHFYHSLKL